jgi:hypothetical protein
MATGTQADPVSISSPPGRTLYATPADYRAVVASLQAGDRLILAPGEYPNGLPIHRLRGTADRPIVIEGAPGASTPIMIGRRGANTVSIMDSEHVVVQNLKLDGKGLPVDGVRVETRSRFSNYITLEALEIVGHGHDQQIVGISVQRASRGWIIRGNSVIGAGTGMYLGHSDGTAPFVDGLIEGNLIRDTLGYNLQIKHQKDRTELASGPTSPTVTIIRDNVFSKAEHASRGALARPNVLVGHFPLTGGGKDDAYLIYRNFFYANPSEALFQGEGNIALYNNVFVNHLGDAVHVQPHNAVPRSVDIFFNTVIARGTGIRVRGGDPANLQRVFANVVFADQPTEGGRQTDNVTGSLHDAAQHLYNPLEPIGALDVRPLPGSLARIQANASIQDIYPDARRDFDGHSRVPDFPGAYAGAGRGWALDLRRKSRLAR